jgi:hypothetical protein
MEKPMKIGEHMISNDKLSLSTPTLRVACHALSGGAFRLVGMRAFLGLAT